MTRRRMPQRDHRGKFLPSAQRDERPPAEDRTPSGAFCFECAAHPQMDADKEPCFSCLEGHDEPGWDHPRFRPKRPGQMPLAVRCEECGDEIEYNWMHVGRRSYHVGRCMRCVPEPPIIE